MKYLRKNNSIAIVTWCLLSVIYFEILFILLFSVAIVIGEKLKLGVVRSCLGVFSNFDWIDTFYLLLFLIMFTGWSISLTKSGVTQIVIDNELGKISFMYQSSKYLFFKQRILEIPFCELDYFVDRSKHPKLNRAFNPFLPVDMIVFYKNNHYLLQFGDSQGWSRAQFNEIESQLRKIKPPCPHKKGY